MWHGVDYLFIDEISMIGCKLLAKIHNALQIAKELKLPFGGVNIIFASDFAQLPCVQDTCLYSKMSFNKPNNNVVLGKLL
jgi:hypothetical protein